jgi:transcriptional regulator PpsR
MTTRGARYWNSGSIPLIGPDILGDIIATLSDLAVVISSEGKVLSVLPNPVHNDYADLNRWERSDLRDFLTPESVPKFERALAAYLSASPASRPVELNHQDHSMRWEFPISYTLHRIGPDGTILMLGRDLRPVAEMQQQLVQAQIALEKDYELQRENDTRFQILLGHVVEAVVFVSIATGQIVELNEAAAHLMGRQRDALTGRPFAGEVVGYERAALMAELVTVAARTTSSANAAAGGTAAGGVELVMARTRQFVRVHPVLFRSSGEQVVLCRLESADRLGAGWSESADEQTQELANLFDFGADAIITTDDAGVIRFANEAFLNLVDVADLPSVRGRPLSDFLMRGAVELKVLLNGAGAAGRVRHYATRLLGEYGGQRSVSLSVTHLSAGQRSGYGLVIREQGPAVTGAGPVLGLPASARAVDELVGTIPMKDIVAQTADVVERMCIEAAIEMTGNNRVAAATMLGLSRQSLYVKLRKYGLIGPESDPPSKGPSY